MTLHGDILIVNCGSSSIKLGVFDVAANPTWSAIITALNGEAVIGAARGRTYDRRDASDADVQFVAIGARGYGELRAAASKAHRHAVASRTSRRRGTRRPECAAARARMRKARTWP